MERLPVLPLGQLVVYPHVVLPLALTDPKAVQLIDEIIQGEKRVLLGVVKSMGGMEPPEGAVMNTLPHQLYDVGTLGTIVRMLKLGDGSVRVMVQGLERAPAPSRAPSRHPASASARSCRACRRRRADAARCSLRRPRAVPSRPSISRRRATRASRPG